MPLTPGASRAVIGRNIEEMQASGHPHKQAVAAALNTARQYRKHAQMGRALPLQGDPGIGAQENVFAGPLHSHVPGRTDKINLNVKPGSYVIPADVVSILGEGNTLAGTVVLRAMYGAKGLTGKVKAPAARPTIMERRLERHEMLPPHQYARGGRDDWEPPMPSEGNMWSPYPNARGKQVPISAVESDMKQEMRGYDMLKDDPKSIFYKENWKNDPTYNMARPGAKKRRLAEGGSDPRTQGAAPVVVAGGEFVIDPEQIKAKYGDLEHGHKSLDELVHAARDYEIKRLKNAPPPKK
jgi:hypothetical protein